MSAAVHFVGFDPEEWERKVVVGISAEGEQNLHYVVEMQEKGRLCRSSFVNHGMVSVDMYLNCCYDSYAAVGVSFHQIDFPVLFLDL